MATNRSVEYLSDRLVSRHQNAAGVTVWPVTLAQAKDRTQVWHNADDSVIDPERYGLVAEAVDMVETEARVALITQVREVVWKTIPTAYEMPVWPVQSIDSITYTDSDDNEATAADPTVVLYGHGKPPIFTQTALTLAAPVTVRYTAGFGDDIADVPHRYLSLVKQVVSHLWNHRDPSGDASEKFQRWFDRALAASGILERYA